MLRPITDVEWAHIDDLLGSGPRPNVVGAWLWLTGRMEISRTTFESRLRARRLTSRSAGQAHAARAASTEEPDGAHGHACTAAQTSARCPASELPLSAVGDDAPGFVPTEDDAGSGALGPELSTASELCEDDLAGQTEHSEVAAVLGPRAQSVYDRRARLVASCRRGASLVAQRFRCARCGMCGGTTSGRLRRRFGLPCQIVLAQLGGCAELGP